MRAPKQALRPEHERIFAPLDRRARTVYTNLEDASARALRICSELEGGVPVEVVDDQSTVLRIESARDAAGALADDETTPIAPMPRR